jgi:hypothetical protein
VNARAKTDAKPGETKTPEAEQQRAEPQQSSWWTAANNLAGSPAGSDTSEPEGHPLSSPVRNRMEGLFGHRFDHVVVHDDPASRDLTGRLSARAFTVGQHIAFAQPQGTASSIEDDAILAHELAHTIQQRGASDHVGSGFANAGAEGDADRGAYGALLGQFSSSSPFAPAAHSSGLELARCTVGDRGPSPPTAAPVAVDTGLVPVNPEMLESDRTREWFDPTTSTVRQVYSPTAGYTRNPSARELSTLVTPRGTIGGGFENGEFMYVIDEQNRLWVGRRMGERGMPVGRPRATGMPHPSLIGGLNPRVKAAGMVRIEAGRIVFVNNHSGHFRPVRSSLRHAARAFSTLTRSVFNPNFEMHSVHFDSTGAMSRRRYRSMRFLPLRVSQMMRIFNRFRWVAIRGRLRGWTRGGRLRSTAGGIAGLIATAIIYYLLGRWMDHLMEQRAEAAMEEIERRVREAIEARQDEIELLLDQDSDAAIFANVIFATHVVELRDYGEVTPGDHSSIGRTTIGPLPELRSVSFSHTAMETGRHESQTFIPGSTTRTTTYTIAEELPLAEMFSLHDEIVGGEGGGEGAPPP